MSGKNNSSDPKKLGPIKIIKKGTGKFQKGKTGNPNGRPKGSRNKTTMMVQALFDGDAEKIYQIVHKLAIEDEFWPALKASLDRVLPPLKSTPLAFEMPPLKTLDDLVKGHREVIDAFARGDITADDARVFDSLLSGARDAMATADLAERVATLEHSIEEIK